MSVVFTIKFTIHDFRFPKTSYLDFGNPPCFVYIYFVSWTGVDSGDVILDLWDVGGGFVLERS
jgi:hypothetical protein